MRQAIHLVDLSFLSDKNNILYKDVITQRANLFIA